MERSINSDFIRGHIDTIILYSLLDSDKYAQQISDSIELKSNKLYQINQATLYSSLKRLESLSYVKSYWYDAEYGRRKYIQITDSGKQFLEQNMAEWAFSKKIIDDLIDIEPEKIVKIVEIKSPTENSNSKIDDNQIKSAVQPEIKLETPATVEKPVLSETESVNEKGFRNILNALIKIDNDSTLSTEKNDSKADEKLNLNDTIVKSSHEAEIPIVSHDYGDLTSDFKNDEFKIRISSKKARRTSGSIYVNKLNLYSSLFTFLLVFVQFLAVFISSGTILNINGVKFVIFSLVFLLFPIIKLGKFISKENKLIQKLNFDSVLISFIVLFNVVLISFVLNLLFGVEFGDFSTIFYTLYLPIMFSANAFVYYLIRYILSKFKKFIYIESN